MIIFGKAHLPASSTSEAQIKVLRNSRFLFMLAAVVFLSATTLSASPIFGTFDFGGTITVTGTSSISWTLPPPNVAHVGTTTSGSFAGPPDIASTNITIANLTNPPQTPGVLFPDFLFITFPSNPALPNLELNMIPLGTFSSAACGLPAAAGQTCTLPGSPFNLTNQTAHSSTVGFSFSGVTSDGLSTWSGTFTTQFTTMNYQQVLATLGTVGHVTNTYSAQITAVPNPTIPEPNTVLMVLGAFGVFVGCFRKKRIASLK